MNEKEEKEFLFKIKKYLNVSSTEKALRLMEMLIETNHIVVFNTHIDSLDLVESVGVNGESIQLNLKQTYECQK